MVEAVDVTDLANLGEEEFKQLGNQPKYLDSIEKEILKLFENAKVDTSQMGFDLDKEILYHMYEE